MILYATGEIQARACLPRRYVRLGRMQRGSIEHTVRKPDPIERDVDLGDGWAEPVLLGIVAAGGLDKPEHGRVIRLDHASERLNHDAARLEDRPDGLLVVAAGRAIDMHVAALS